MSKATVIEYYIAYQNIAGGYEKTPAYTTLEKAFKKRRNLEEQGIDNYIVERTVTEKKILDTDYIYKLRQKEKILQKSIEDLMDERDTVREELNRMNGGENG